MEVSGTITQVMPVEEFQGGQLKKQTFVVEIPDGKYTNHLAVDMWNDKITPGLQPGMQVDVKCNVRSKQGKGQHAARWFTNVSAWMVAVHGENRPQAAPPAAPPEAPSASVAGDYDDSLPF